MTFEDALLTVQSYKSKYLHKRAYLPKIDITGEVIGFDIVVDKAKVSELAPDQEFTMPQDYERYAREHNLPAFKIHFSIIESERDTTWIAVSLSDFEIV